MSDEELRHAIEIRELRLENLDPQHRSDVYLMDMLHADLAKLRTEFEKRHLT